MNNGLINGARILITGGTGSWGHEVVLQLLEKYPDLEEIRVYSRGEHKQVEMKREFNFHPKIKFIIGDVRDKNILNYAMKNIDIVFHLAALKHVPVCEENTWEAILTNINGTQNVIEAALNNEVKMVVDISTDKAVEPFNLYGMTKACGEKLIINANYNYSYDHAGITKFVCVRGGNVIGTNGSVIPLFKEQLRKNNEITVTNPDMTRFLMSTRQAISLIFTAIERSIGGELFIMRMPAATVGTIAQTMISLFGNEKSAIRIIGERPGEKMHEVLVSKNEVPLTYKFSKEHYVILPQIQNEALIMKYNMHDKIEHNEFTSANADQLTQYDLEEILKKEKWLWQG